MTGEKPTAPRVLVDASNLRVGGGVQVAASLVDELMSLREDDNARAEHPVLDLIEFSLSPEVFRNLTSDVSSRKIVVERSHWYKPGIWLGRSRDWDVQLTVFGPRYGRRRAPLTITGIADGTSIYAWPDGVDRGSYLVRLKRALRSRVSRALFKNESLLVSESASLLTEFQQRMGYPEDRGFVVSNSVSRAVSDPDRREQLGRNLRDGVSPETVLLAYVARFYPHKNHKVLPRVRDLLLDDGLDVRFVVTMTDEEWESAPDQLRRSCINAGVVSVSRIGDLNLQCDGAIFPSLLESYSATPVESLVMGLPLFASDRPYVRDTCQDAAVYFDPLDPIDIAARIRETLADSEKLEELAAGRARVSASLGTPGDRALAFLEIVEKAWEEPR